MSNSSNLRRAPAFQEYASDLLSMEDIRLMSLGERGLLATMRWYCWANDTLPADPKLMARLLGLDEADVRGNLTEAVLNFFAPAKGFSGSNARSSHSRWPSSWNDAGSNPREVRAARNRDGRARNLSAMGNPLAYPMAEPMASRWLLSREETRRTEAKDLPR
jgi:hypothetical protein